MRKDKLSRKLKDFLKFQKKENRARKNQEYSDLFGCIGPIYYDTLVEQWLTPDELSEFFSDLSTEQIRTLFKHLSDATFYSHILKNFSELDLEFVVISDERMLKFFENYGDHEFFAYMFLQMPKHISEKVRLIEVFDRSDCCGIAKWLSAIFHSRDNRIEEKNDFFKFIEELVGNTFYEKRFEHLFAKIISTDLLLEEIILADEKGIFTDELLRRLQGTETFFRIFTNIHNIDDWFTIIEKIGDKNFAKLKGEVNVVEVFKNKPDEMYDLFSKFYQNFWLFFTLEDVVTIYRAFITDETVYEDYIATILYGIKNYSENVAPPYLEFYSMLAEDEKLKFLKNMLELSDEMSEIVEYVLRSQVSLSFYEDLLFKHLEAEAKKGN